MVLDWNSFSKQLDNTLIVLVYSDNGTSAEGGRNGMFSEMSYFNGVQDQVSDILTKMDTWGGPETCPHMAAGWAVVFDTPYQWTKQVASDHGGTKVGMTKPGIPAGAVSCPNRHHPVVPAEECRSKLPTAPGRPR